MGPPSGDRAPTADLSADDLAAIREDLLEQRAFREEQLRRIAAEGDGSPARVEVRITLAASARMVLADVEAALCRIAEGRYGRCRTCRRPIGRAHLLIVPQTRYCARCQRGPGEGPVREGGR
ncbi:TraR/DksA C4-type zinc finger protein [Streptomyces sp. NPDC048290]|uniref:TraR/DksA family transcriptional regulator n=1 Tax=Streptomyces sp. NPDC048290 TaxID=3155811 RepID=UPI003421319B